jgi:hypothetical protein
MLRGFKESRSLKLESLCVKVESWTGTSSFEFFAKIFQHISGSGIV